MSSLSDIKRLSLTLTWKSESLIAKVLISHQWLFGFYIRRNVSGMSQRYCFFCSYTYVKTLFTDIFRKCRFRWLLKLTFKSHIKNLCKKASQKIGALSRLSNHLNDSQKRLILNSIVKSQFSYCPLVWMFCSRTSNNMINKVHERALRVLLNDHESDFEKLLHINNHVCNHHRNIKTLLIEMNCIFWFRNN